MYVSKDGSMDEKTVRIAVAILTGIAIPISVVLAYASWIRRARVQLSSWRNGAGLASMLFISALWLKQVIQLACPPVNLSEVNLLSVDWREADMFFTTLYAYSALPLAFALKDASRPLVLGSWFLLVLFYGAFTYT
jgi:hypothetical protein